MDGGEIAATAGLSGWIAGMATASVLGIPAGALVAALDALIAKAVGTGPALTPAAMHTAKGTR